MNNLVKSIWKSIMSIFFPPKNKIKTDPKWIYHSTKAPFIWGVTGSSHGMLPPEPSKYLKVICIETPQQTDNLVKKGGIYEVVEILDFLYVKSGKRVHYIFKETGSNMYDSSLFKEINTQEIRDKLINDIIGG